MKRGGTECLAQKVGNQIDHTRHPQNEGERQRHDRFAVYIIRKVNIKPQPFFSNPFSPMFATKTSQMTAGMQQPKDKADNFGVGMTTKSEPVFSPF